MTTVKTIDDACALAREELKTFETAAQAVRRAGPAHARAARAQMETSRGVIDRLLADAGVIAVGTPRAQREGIPDPVPDVDQDPQD